MKISSDKLGETIFHLLKHWQATDEEAALVRDCLLRAEMRGIDTHGVYFLKLLSERIDARMIRVPTVLHVVREDETTALLDGGNGLGQVAAHRAMSLAIQKARQFGTGLVLVRNTNHIGILAFYSVMAAQQGMVGVVLCNSAPSMSPWGGAEPFFGTNPLSIAIPGEGSDPIVLDMSSSIVARGKIRRAQRMKEPIPLGWALDENGQPTTDPDAALKGTLLPIGGPKGYGLAFMIDILTGMLSGSHYGPAVRSFHELSGPTGIGVLTLALDIERFMPLAQFKERLASYTGSLRKVRRAKGVSRIYLPGEIELEKEKKSLEEGIELSDSTVRSLNQLLEKAKSPLRLEEDS